MKRTLLKFYTQCLNERQQMLCECYWIVLYTMHVTAFWLGGGRFSDAV